MHSYFCLSFVISCISYVHTYSSSDRNPLLWQKLHQRGTHQKEVPLDINVDLYSRVERKVKERKEQRSVSYTLSYWDISFHNIPDEPRSSRVLASLVLMPEARMPILGKASIATTNRWPNNTKTPLSAHKTNQVSSETWNQRQQEK